MSGRFGSVAAVFLSACVGFVSSCSFPASSATGPSDCSGGTTSFESTDRSGQFVLGDSPATASFSGGLSQSLGILSLYRSGVGAWMVQPGATGTITFETPARQVTFFTRDQSSGGASRIEIRDTAGLVISSTSGTTRFVKIDLSIDPSTENGIASIELQNTSGTGWAVIDDFSFCAIEANQTTPG